MQLRSLGYVGIESTQWKLWEEVGPAVFGFGLAPPAADDGVRLRIDDRHHRIAIHPSESDKLSYIGWEVATSDDFQAAWSELQAKDVAVHEGSPDENESRRVQRMIHFQDPAGFRHEIFFGPEERYRSFAADSRHGGFVTGNQGMGHIVLIVPDTAPMHQFVTEILPFNLTDMVTSPRGNALFYRLNPRHHSLALIGAGQRRGLHHIMVQVNRLDDLGLAYDRVQERIAAQEDMALRITLGRHATDQMVSFYVDTPSGFTVEYGWGGLEIDDSDWVVKTATLPAEVWGHKFVAEQPLPRTVERVA